MTSDIVCSVLGSVTKDTTKVAFQTGFSGAVAQSLANGLVGTRF